MGRSADTSSCYPATAFCCLPLANMEGPFLFMRSTPEKPRCYGARLYVGENYVDDDFGSMELVKNDSEVRELVRGLTKAAFGDNAQS